MKILIVSLNPAIDKTLYINTPLFVGGLNRVSNATEKIGGKGYNVACAISKLAGDCECDRVSLLTFAHPDEMSDYKKAGFNVITVPSDCRTRVCTKIIDRDGAQTELNGQGGPYSEEEIKKFITIFAEAISTDPPDVTVLCGSIPQGVEKSVYFQLIFLLNSLKCYSVLDCDGEGLRLAMSARPSLIKPNIHELYGLYVAKNSNSAVSEKEFSTTTVAVEFAKSLSCEYGTSVLCTMGGEGAFYVNAEGEFYTKRSQKIPQSEIAYLAGAGDTYLGTFLYERFSGSGISEAMDTADMRAGRFIKGSD